MPCIDLQNRVQGENKNRIFKTLLLARGKFQSKRETSHNCNKMRIVWDQRTSKNSSVLRRRRGLGDDLDQGVPWHYYGIAWVNRQQGSTKQLEKVILNGGGKGGQFGVGNPEMENGNEVPKS